MSFRVNRRDFLRFAGGGTLGLATAGLSLQSINSLNAALAREQMRVPGGPEAWSLSLCSLCPGGCGLRVRTIGRRAVKIQGNPLHPVNRGGLCPLGLAGLQVLYHPDRLRSPQKNAGSREAPRWQDISWEEAIGIVTERLRDLRQRNLAHTVVFLAGRAGHLRQRLFQRFLHAYGSPNYLEAPSGLEAMQSALYLQQGMSEGLAYDLERTRYLLSFGVNLLDGWGAPVSVMRAFGRWRDSAAGRRTKFVQIEPRFSSSSSRADEWVALRPGTEAALALGIAFVLISEGLYDARFVEERTFGFDDWRGPDDRTHLGFRSLVMSEYRLNEVAALTQVPVETILRVGREFGRNRPALAIGGQPGNAVPGNPFTAMAVHSLNALMGSLETPGGVLARPPLPEDEPPVPGQMKLPPSVVKADNTPFPWEDLTRLPEAILTSKPYPVRALLVHGFDPVFALPNGQQLGEALKQVPFVVSFSPFLDETSARADLILPDHTDLEKWQETASPPTFPFPLQAVAPPAVEPLHESRDSADVLLGIAHALGEAVAAALPQTSFEEFLGQQAEALFAAHAGYVFTSSVEETWNRLLERSGWWAPTYSTAEQLWEQMRERGGWWEPTYFYGEWERAFRTPSGRFEFYSQALAGWVKQHRQAIQAAGFDPNDDRLCLPHQSGLSDPPQGYPLRLLPFDVLPLAGGNGAHLPYTQQIAGLHVFEHWQSWLEMNPETAAQLGLEEREEVWIESTQGRARVRLRVYPGVRPGVVHLPLGYGRTQGSPWGQRGVNPWRLLETRREPPFQFFEMAPTFVRVYRS